MRNAVLKDLLESRPRREMAKIQARTRAKQNSNRYGAQCPDIKINANRFNKWILLKSSANLSEMKCLEIRGKSQKISGDPIDSTLTILLGKFPICDAEFDTSSINKNYVRLSALCV